MQRRDFMRSLAAAVVALPLAGLPAPSEESDLGAFIYWEAMDAIDTEQLIREAIEAEKENELIHGLFVPVSPEPDRNRWSDRLIHDPDFITIKPIPS